MDDTKHCTREGCGHPPEDHDPDGIGACWHIRRTAKRKFWCKCTGYLAPVA